MQKTKPSFMSNVIMLMLSQIVIKLLGLVYRLVITNLDGFGNIGNGYYAAGYQIYALLLTVSSIGIPSAISKLVAEKAAVGDNKGAHRIFKIALIIFGAIGGALSLGLLIGAPAISTYVLKVPDVKYTLMALSPAIVLVSLSAVIRGYFAGLGSMAAASTSQLIEQFFNSVLTITLVYALIGRDPAMMAAGGNLATTLSVLLSITYLFIFYRAKRKGIKEGIENSTVTQRQAAKRIAKAILALAIPISLGSLITALNAFIDTATVTNCIQTAFKTIIVNKEELEQLAMHYTGILSKMETLTNMPLAINLAFSVSLVPAIAGAIAKKDYNSAAKRINFSFFASILIILPCAVGMIVLADPILKLLYPNAADGAQILQIYAVTMTLIALNQTINGGLQGIGKVFIPAFALTLGAVIKVILNILLVSNPSINVFGAAISSLVCQIISFTICFIVFNKNLKIKINIVNEVLKPIISALAMGICVMFIYNIASTIYGNAISTILAIGIGVLIYILLIIVLRVLDKENICMLPFGKNIYNLLVKMKIYKKG